MVGAVLAGLYLDCLPHVTLGIMAVPLFFTVVVYPKRALIFLIGVQIALEFTQLDMINFYIGPMRARLDDLLFWWVMLLWLLALPDGEARAKTGATSRLILILVGIGTFSLFFGLASGNDPGHATYMFKQYPGYLSFFPAAWLISRDRKTADQLVTVIIIAGVLAGINIALRGHFRLDETVYERGTGLRVQARQAFAIGVGLLFLLSKNLYLRNRSQLKLIIPAGVVMMAGIVLSQTRSVWFGTLLGAGVMLALFSFSPRRNTWLVIRRIAGMALLVVLLFGVSGYILQSAGFLQIEDVVKRTGPETRSHLTDATFLARAVSWMEIIREVGNPPGLLFGKGMGYEITYFRFDYMEEMSWSTVDNSYFQILLNAGIPGVLALLSLYLYGIVKSAVLAGREKNPERESNLLAVCGSLVMLASGSFFMSAITNYRFTVLYGVLFAILSVAPGNPPGDPDLTRRE